MKTLTTMVVCEDIHIEDYDMRRHWVKTMEREDWGVSLFPFLLCWVMPILFNFHILLATFYIIFGTNILIQCLVPVPVCWMFYVSQKTNIKRNPNGIKTDGEYFWNIWRIPKEKSTWDGARGRHEAGAHAHSRWARLPPSWAPHKAVDALLWPQES